MQIFSQKNVTKNNKRLRYPKKSTNFAAILIQGYLSKLTNRPERSLTL